MAFRSLFIVFFSLTALANSNRSCYEASLELERSIGVTSNSTKEDVTTPMGEVFNQKNTQWCWAYSSYHTMRTYYWNTTDNNNEVTEWKKAMEPMNSDKGFKSFMGANYSTGNTGEPMKFVKFFQKKYSLPSTPWKAYWKGGAEKRWPSLNDYHPSESSRTSITEIAKKIRASLLKGEAVAYCYPPHCVTIYGAAFEGETAKEYLIADSIGGRKYRADAKKALAKLDVIMVRD